MTIELEQIDGIEQLEKAPPGSQPFTRRYYLDNAEDLVRDAKALPVREQHCIVPRDGWPKRIFRKPEGKQ
jgi:hypothetical protein